MIKVIRKMTLSWVQIARLVILGFACGSLVPHVGIGLIIYDLRNGIGEASFWFWGSYYIGALLHDLLISSTLSDIEDIVTKILKKLNKED